MQEVEPEQIVKCKIEGCWDYRANNRKRLFMLLNVQTVHGEFMKFNSTYS